MVETYRTGMLDLIQACRDEGYYPVITLAYPNDGFTSTAYRYLKEMNLEMNTWDVPSINLLGVIDDGNGRWADGFFFNAGHPNYLGHAELFLAIPPSLFEAIESGKTTVPTYPSGSGYVRLARDAGQPAPFLFTPSHAVHSFTTRFRVRSGGTPWRRSSLAR